MNTHLNNIFQNTCKYNLYKFHQSYMIFTMAITTIISEGIELGAHIIYAL